MKRVRVSPRERSILNNVRAIRAPKGSAVAVTQLG
jgi:hypothetical protein